MIVMYNSHNHYRAIVNDNGSISIYEYPDNCPDMDGAEYSDKDAIRMIRIPPDTEITWVSEVFHSTVDGMIRELKMRKKSSYQDLDKVTAIDSGICCGDSFLYMMRE